jgi:hypothetical protein
VITGTEISCTCALPSENGAQSMYSIEVSEMSSVGIYSGRVLYMCVKDDKWVQNSSGMCEGNR